MKIRIRINRTRASLVAIAVASTASPAFAADGEDRKTAPPTAWEASRITIANDRISTGTARARDRLDSATSTSSTSENEIVKLAPRSLAELLRNIPGVRVEASAGEAGNSFTVRGLPLATEGSKYFQLQEDGLPVLEFGDILGQQPDNFTRLDLNIGQIESIRGGSASTFASNAPGGVVNLVSKTGEVQGGSVQATGGLNYESYRLDADYGGRLSDTVRFHIGGFYRRGEGPRTTGFTATRGGQVKLNVTKEFSNGYIRVYGKYLDDHTPLFYQTPTRVTGTDDHPKFETLPGFSVKSDSLYSRNIDSLTVVDADGRIQTSNYRNTTHAKVKSAGFEAQFDVAGFTVANRFRYSDISSSESVIYSAAVGTPGQLAGILGIPDARFTYASGPSQGGVFDPANGNGLLSLTLLPTNNAPNMNNLTDDLRASRVWKIGGGNLTTTAGIYKAHQNFDREVYLSTVIQDVVGDGKSSLVNVAAAGGAFPISQDGYLLYSPPGNAGNTQLIDVTYKILSPYGSLNFQKGKFAIGGSLRYDTGKVDGRVARSLPGNLACVDIDGDGRSVPGTAECTVAVFPAANYRPVDYDYDYLSYSVGVNFRASEPLAVFARYSRGARAAADAIVFSPALDAVTGRLLDKSASHDPVKQAEAGLKYRNGGVTFNVTVFRATTSETNSQINRDANGDAIIAIVSRSYKAYGAEFESGVRRGPFSLAASATVAKAEITGSPDATLLGNKPRHQPTAIYQLTPQYDGKNVSIGANIVGVTRSYASDANRLRLPAYTTVGLFVQYSPIEKVVLGINANNVFDTLAVTETLDDAVPANNVIEARTLYGRTVSASMRLFF